MSLSISCSLSLYADDSAIYFAHRNASNIAERLSRELSLCKKWLVDNKLSLHVGKTESILFGSKGRLRTVRDFTVFCEGTAVDRVSQVKYLGALLDANLSGSHHAVNVLKTCAGRLAFLFRNSSLMDVRTRKMLCTALIQPHLDYCVSSWYSGLTAILKRRLDVIQRKMARFVFDFDRRRHVGNAELNCLSWLNVPDRVNFFKLVHIYRIRHDLAPPYLRSSFTGVAQTHSYRTRGSEMNYHLSKELSLAPTSFAFTGIKQWNCLPDCIRQSSSLMVFKSKLRKYLLNRYS